MPTKAKTPDGQDVFIWDPDKDFSEEESYALCYVMWLLEPDAQKKGVLRRRFDDALRLTREADPSISDSDMKGWLVKGLKELANKRVIDMRKDGEGAFEPVAFYPGRIHMPDAKPDLAILEGE